MTTTSKASKPLTPAVLHILLSLADGEKHGYAIMQFVARQSDGTVSLGAGTLYGAVKGLLELAWIEEVVGRVDDDDQRRRYYRLTVGGEQALRTELKRLDGILKAASLKGLLAAVVA